MKNYFRVFFHMKEDGKHWSVDYSLHDDRIYNLKVPKHVFDNRTLQMVALNDRLHLHQLCSITDK